MWFLVVPGCMSTAVTPDVRAEAIGELSLTFADYAIEQGSVLQAVFPAPVQGPLDRAIVDEQAVLDSPDVCQLVEVVGDAEPVPAAENAGGAPATLWGRVDDGEEVTLLPLDRGASAPGVFRALFSEMPERAVATVRAADGEIDGFGPESLPPLPPFLGPAGPPGGGRFPRNATFSWSGATFDTVYLDWFAFPRTLARTLWLSCELVDDGSFTLPADLLDPVPSNWGVSWTLRRTAEQARRLGDGRVLVLRSEVTWSPERQVSTQLE